MAAEEGCEVRLAVDMEHVELKEGEVAVADDGFVIIIQSKKLQIPVKTDL